MEKTDPRRPEAVLDASAPLALINEERGARVVSKAIADGAAISVVNWIEVLSKLAEEGGDPKAASAEITATTPVETAIKIEPVTTEDAIEAARLRPLTGLGDLSATVRLIR